MDSRTYLKKQLSVLGRARLLSRIFFIIAGLAVIASLVLPSLQKAAVDPETAALSHWENSLLQLPSMDKGDLWVVYLGALALVWMAYMLRTLVTIAEIQCVDLDE